MTHELRNKLLKVLQNDKLAIKNRGQLAVELGVEDHELFAINCKFDAGYITPFDYFKELIDTWIGKNGEQSTTEKFVQILRRLHFNNAADQLENDGDENIIDTVGQPLIRENPSCSQSSGTSFRVPRFSHQDNFHEVVNPPAVMTWVSINANASSTGWHPYSSLPSNAVLGGTDNGDNLYVARAKHSGCKIPGKLHLHRGCPWVFIPYDMKEIRKSEFEILLAPHRYVDWVEVKDARIPEESVIGGQDPSGEVLFIGRAKHLNSWTVGKIQPSHKTCYVSYGGKVFRYSKCEILVTKTSV